MFDIIRALEEQWAGQFSWEQDATFEVEIVDVCEHSGYRPGPNCPRTKTTTAVKNAHPFVECPFHQKFIVEKETGFRASPWRKYGEGEVVEQVVVVYPPSVQKVLGGAGKEPEFPPDFTLVEDKSSLNVVSPVDGAVYFIPFGVRGAGCIPLQGFTSSKEDKIHWFLNGQYHGATQSGEIMEVEPEGSRMKIAAQDAAGTNQVITIKIEKE
jgi:membrane carboxypeptidase/penicillin-binding protein PbpC